jgi:DNA-binding CsgD family transcriptional regulator
MILTPSDLQSWTRALTSQPRHHDGLMAWVTGPLREFFPFQRVLLAHGAQVAGQIQITHWLANGHDARYLQQMDATFDLANRGALHWWLTQRQPFCIDTAWPSPFTTQFELDEIRDFELGRVAGHGILNATASAGTYFSFAGIPKQLSDWHLDALTLIAPVLNDLFLSYVAAQQKDLTQLLAALTKRQTDIVRLVVNGLDDKSVACELAIAEKTVRNHLSTIYSHLGVYKRAQLVALLR